MPMYCEKRTFKLVSIWRRRTENGVFHVVHACYFQVQVQPVLSPWMLLPEFYDVLSQSLAFSIHKAALTDVSSLGDSGYMIIRSNSVFSQLCPQLHSFNCPKSVLHILSHCRITFPNDHDMFSDSWRNGTSPLSRTRRAMQTHTKCNFAMVTSS